MLAHSGLPGRRASGRPGRPGPAGEWKPELISIRVDKPGPRREMAPGRSLPRTGTYLALWIPDPEKRLVRFERGQSKLEAFTDEKGTDLSKITLRPFGWSRFGTFHASRSTEGSEGFLVEVAGEGLPAPGATKIQLKATLAFSQGSSEKTVEEKNLRVQEAREIEVGAVTLYMEPPGAHRFGLPDLRPRPIFDADQQIAEREFSLVSNEPLDWIKALKILDPEGMDLGTENGTGPILAIEVSRHGPLRVAGLRVPPRDARPTRRAVRRFQAQTLGNPFLPFRRAIRPPALDAAA